MLKRTICLCAAALLAAAALLPAASAEDKPANALLVVPSGTAFDKKFQDFLAKNGAKLLHSHPPSVFVGLIPAELDKQLREKFGAEVYREKVEDWASFARYGENAVYAVNAWNKGFQEDPPEAPLVVSTRVQKAGRKGETLKLVWNEVMKAHSYRLQIAQDEAFERVVLETVAQRSQYPIVPAFWPDGVYYWRVAGVMKLNTGEDAEGAYSQAYTFAVSKPARAPGPKLGAPSLPERTRVKGRPLSWAAPAAFKYYHLQLSETADFSAPLVDVFTDTCTFKLSGLPLKWGDKYYMRVMGSDGASYGEWSRTSEVVVESPGPIPGDVKRRKQKR